MPPIGNRDGTFAWPTWSDPAYRQKTPQWPHPQTPRVDGRLRWLSDPNVYPVSTRYLARMECYSNSVPDFTQWFWFDLAHDSGLKFAANSGEAAFSTSFDFSFAYYDSLPHLGVPGCRQEFTYYVADDDPAERAMEWTNSPPGYPLNYVAGIPDPDWSDPEIFAPDYSGEYNRKDVYIIPISECFPADQCTAEGGIPVPGALIYRADSTLSINTTTTITFANGGYNYGGWFDLGSDNTKLIVPSGINFVKLWGNINCSGSSSTAVLFILKNGSTFVGSPASRATPNTGTSAQLNCSTPWIPVSTGDYFTMGAAQASGSISATGILNWFAIEGANEV